jgi:tetratricopeptide (TPR) repeat protein
MSEQSTYATTSSQVFMSSRLYPVCILLFFSLYTTMHADAQNKNIGTIFRTSYQQAEKEYKNGSVVQALALYKKTLRKKNTPKVKLKIAHCYQSLNQSQEAEQWYREAATNTYSLEKQDLFNYAEVLLSNGKYNESLSCFEKFVNTYGQDSSAAKRIRGIKEQDAFFVDSLNFNIRFIKANSTASELAPSFYKTGLVFASNKDTEESSVRLTNPKDESLLLNLYYGELDSTKNITKTLLLSPQINGKLNEGTCSFYNKGNSLFFTQNSDRKKKLISSAKTFYRLGIFHSNKDTIHDVWQTPKPFIYNNPSYSLGHPAVSEDGKTLYFASDQPGGFGGTDLYVSYLKDTLWTNPINLGAKVNTTSDELFPFIYNDSTLYFSSKGHEGLGGLDIYKTSKKEQDFDNPENVGYPVNSTQDDFGIIFSENKKWGYFVSNRKNKGSDDDIYVFDVIKVFVAGSVKSHLKKAALENVTINVFRNNKKTTSTQSDEKGNFSLMLDPGKKYNIVLSKEDYISARTVLSTPISEDSSALDVIMEKESRSFVKGVVKSNKKIIPSLTIYAMGKNTFTTERLLSNNAGEFSTEIDPDEDYLFFAEYKDQFGQIILKSSKERKGSFLFYANIMLNPYETSPIECLVQKNKLPVAHALVVIHHQLTNQRDTLQTNEEGKASFVAKSYTNYRIDVISDEGKADEQDLNINYPFKNLLLFTLKEE